MFISQDKLSSISKLAKWELMFHMCFYLFPNEYSWFRVYFDMRVLIESGGDRQTQHAHDGACRHMRGAGCVIMFVLPHSCTCIVFVSKQPTCL